MTDHLPECFERELIGLDCICDRLRACEQRVKSETRAIYIALAAKSGAEMFDAGVQAARDAVKNVPCPEGYEVKGCSHWDDAIVAIDALKEKP